MGLGISYGDIARMHRMSESVVCETYTLISPQRDEPFDNKVNGIIATDDLKRIVGAWPLFI